MAMERCPQSHPGPDNASAVRSTSRILVAQVSACVAVALAGCAGSAPISVNDAWARTSPSGVTTGAVYMELTARTSDVLQSVTVPAVIADHAEIHEVVPAVDISTLHDNMMDGQSGMSDEEMMAHESMDMTEEEVMTHHMMDSSDGSMAMMMQEVAELQLSAQTTVVFEPGGLHVMLVDLAEPLEIGDTFDITLHFANAEDRVVAVEVRDT